MYVSAEHKMIALEVCDWLKFATNERQNQKAITPCTVHVCAIFLVL